MKIFLIGAILILCSPTFAHAYFAEDLNRPTANVITQEKYQEQEARLQRDEALEAEGGKPQAGKEVTQQWPEHEEASEAINERIDREEVADSSPDGPNR